MNAPDDQGEAPDIEGLVRHLLGDLLGREADSLSGAAALRDLGLDSIGTISLARRLARALGREISPIAAWQHPTIDRLTRFLTGGERAKDRGSSPSAALAEPIAIVGIACRFPGGADTPDGLWENLCKGVDAIREVPRDRWDADAFYSPEDRPGKIITRRGGFLEQVDGFDPTFFGISPREAEQMDPQQRLMLELSWEALEDAAVAPTTLRGRQVGVFAGAVFTDYGVLQAQAGPEVLTQHSSTGNVQAILANRVSYALGLMGPSLVVNTACSASLVSVHLAAQSLRLGECDVALAGGVQLMLSPDTMVALSSLGALSPDGRCYTFDARANGFVRGEGGGLVVLKRLSHALRDGDRIYAVLQGSAVNNDGPSNGLTAPSPAAQVAMARSALARGCVSPLSVDYVELHGTGTPLGDPIEASALGEVYGEGRPKERPLRVGSIKTNIGHLEGAAGIAGLIKAALCLHHRTLVPSLHYETPSPHIDFEALKLEVVTGTTPWAAPAGGPRRAAVSSFGFGGTNAHAILEEAPRSEVLALPLEAGDAGDAGRAGREEALWGGVDAWIEALAGAHTREAVAATCKAAAGEVGASGLGASGAITRRAAVIGADRSELLDGLVALRHGGTLSPRSSVGEAPSLPLRPVFVFSGLGPQWRGMGRRLYASAPAFRAAMDACDAAFASIGGFPLVRALWNDALDLDDGDAHDVHQPLLIAAQIAVASQWRAWGVEPGAVIGHSVGEVAAACVAGAISIPDAMRIVAQFGARCQRTIDAGGTVMAFVGKPKAALEPLAREHEGAFYITGVNDPGSCVICGEQGIIHDWLARWQSEGTFCKALSRVHCHCPLGAPFVIDMPESLEGIAPMRARVPMISTARGGFVEGPELDARYWTENLSRPVRFADGVEALVRAGHRVFVEASPHPVLTRSIEASLRHMGVGGAAIASQRRDEDGLLTIVAAAGHLFSLGAPVAWPAVLGDEATHAGDKAASQERLPLYLSARTEGALYKYAARLRAHLEGHPEALLRDVSYSLATARSAHEERLVVMVSSVPDACQALLRIERGDAGDEVLRGRVRERRAGQEKVAFVFPGQGAQWQGMGRRLLDRPVFAEAMRACDEALRPYTGFSVTDVIAGRGERTLRRIDVVQPALFAMGVSLAALWKSFGLRPDGVVGHSQGEVAAAYVAGALSLDDAARIIARRSALLFGLSGEGAMAVVGLDEATVRGLLI
jgi:acyl transferase domain-containing protein/aryl carrier-like protein